MLRAAAALSWLIAAGFGLPDIPAIANVARGEGVWYFMGFPTYGHGPFEQIGIPTTVPLLVAFLLVAVAEVVAGVLLWNGRRAGSVLANVLAPDRSGLLDRLRPPVRPDHRPRPPRPDRPRGSTRPRGRGRGAPTDRLAVPPLDLPGPVDELGANSGGWR